MVQGVLFLALLACCGSMTSQLMSTCLYTFSGMYRVDHGVCNVVNTQSTSEYKLISSLLYVNVSVLLMFTLSLKTKRTPLPKPVKLHS